MLREYVNFCSRHPSLSFQLLTVVRFSLDRLVVGLLGVWILMCGLFLLTEDAARLCLAGGARPLL
mgnify:CR=1 FL=1